MTTLRDLAAAAAALMATTMLSGCESGSGETAESLHFRSALIVDGSLPVPRDPAGGTLIGLYALDKAGRETGLDPESVECGSSDPAIAEIRPLGTALMAIALVDRFDYRPYESDDDAGTADDTAQEGAIADPLDPLSDAGDAGLPHGEPYDREPESVIECRSGHALARVTLQGVVDASGTWRVEAAGLTDVLELEQSGRDLIVAGTSEAAGRVTDDGVDLSLQGVTLQGTLSDRYTASGLLGEIEWRARKDP